MIAAIELVRDRGSKKRAIAETEQVMYRCMERGLSFKVAKENDHHISSTHYDKEAAGYRFRNHIHEVFCL